MPEAEDIADQCELLRIHRRNLARNLQQQAEQGGSAFVLPATANGIEHARTEIRRLKTILRGWGQLVEDLPDDEPLDSPATNQPVIEYAKRPQSHSIPTVTASSGVIDSDDIEEYFTDVEHLRGLFKDMVAAPTLPKRLLVIHGVGGAGKSSLLQMFRLHCRRVGVPIALASGDEAKSAVDILTSWHTEFQSAGIPCPALTNMITRYHDVQTTVEQHAKKASAVAGKLAVKTAEGVAGSMAGAAIGSVFPIVGTIAGAAIGAIVGTSGEALVDWLGGFLKKPDVDLLLDPTNLLTDALFADLAQAAPRQRLVLVLDTFERISALENWTRDLVRQAHPNVLLVIAGRAVPNWGRSWPGWLRQAHVEELKPMTSEVMRELVQRYYASIYGGNPDPIQVEAIINFARGLPVVVTSAVQLWVAYGVEDFQSVKPQVVADLVDRLLEGVPHDLVPLLEAAATLRWFNKELLLNVMQQELAAERYDELRRFPFIRSRTEGLALHDAVREILDENLRVSAPKRHRELHERAAVYFEEQPTNSQELETLARERLYHRIRVDEEAGLRLFIASAEQLVQSRRIFQLRGLINDIHTYTFRYENSRLWRDYFTARLAHFEMRLNEAEAVYQRIGQHPEAEPTLRAYALRDYGNILLRSFRLASIGGKERAAHVLEQAIESLPNDVRMIHAMLNLCGVYAELNNHVRVTLYAEQAYQIAEAHADHYSMVLARENLRTIFGLRGNWHEMLAEYRAAQDLLVITHSPYLVTKVLGGLTPAWVWIGRYAEAEQMAKQAIDARQRIGDPNIGRLLKEAGYAIGMQGRYIEADQLFARSLDQVRQVEDQGEEVTWVYQGHIMSRSNHISEAHHLLQQALARPEIAQTSRRMEALVWLAEIHEIQKNGAQAETAYHQVVEARDSYRQHSLGAALTGLVRVKHALDEYSAGLPFFTEAEQLAQQYEYNDHLASLRLSQGHLVWDGRISDWGSGFDAALSFYQHALIYALRYNRFLLDEVLWGGGVVSPLKPIIPHCLERTFEGQRMLIALRDWWLVAINDVGTARTDTISPIPEGIPLRDAERIAREREPGDGTPQQTVLDILAQHI